MSDDIIKIRDHIDNALTELLAPSSWPVSAASAIRHLHSARSMLEQWLIIDRVFLINGPAQITHSKQFND